MASKTKAIVFLVLFILIAAVAVLFAFALTVTVMIVAIISEAIAIAVAITAKAGNWLAINNIADNLDLFPHKTLNIVNNPIAGHNVMTNYIKHLIGILCQGRRIRQYAGWRRVHNYKISHRAQLLKKLPHLRRVDQIHGRIDAGIAGKNPQIFHLRRLEQSVLKIQILLRNKIGQSNRTFRHAKTTLHRLISNIAIHQNYATAALRQGNGQIIRNRGFFLHLEAYWSQAAPYIPYWPSGSV